MAKDVLNEKPSFGARVLVWDVRLKSWDIAYFVRDGQSNTEGYFEQWRRGQRRPLNDARFWQELPESPVGEKE